MQASNMLDSRRLAHLAKARNLVHAKQGLLPEAPDDFDTPVVGQTRQHPRAATIS